MDDAEPGNDAVDRLVTQLFALVSEALAGATHALLAGDVRIAQMVIERDESIDTMVGRAEVLVWEMIDARDAEPVGLRRLVATLLILPELERSADLAEHVAQRALTGLGEAMTPLSRGIVQRMTEVGLEMWQTVAGAYSDRSHQAIPLDEADEEIDVLHKRLTGEVALGTMDTATAAQVTLLARFYERLGDHAVNLARRISAQQITAEDPPPTPPAEGAR
ncbi:MAG: phosphate transport system regulatory protein PhoU [Actinomycetota bacterium]|nr:phosphate transport system regulatory protein PhoU [Actinomycetota bacterium]